MLCHHTVNISRSKKIWHIWQNIYGKYGKNMAYMAKCMANMAKNMANMAKI